MRFSLCVVLLAASVGLAAPPSLDIPAEIKPTGSYVRMTPKTDAVSVVYVGLDGLDPFPSEELKDGKRFLLPAAGLAVGRYRFVAVAAGATGEQSRADFVVVIGDAPKPPPTPIPPPTPVPTDPLVTAFQVAYTADVDPDKAKLTPVLADLLGAVVAAAKTSGQVKTTTQLEAAVHKAADIAVGPGKIMGVRTAVGAYLSNSTLPKPGTAAQTMTDALWAAATAEYAKVSTALKGVK